MRNCSFIYNSQPKEKMMSARIKRVFGYVLPSIITTLRVALTFRIWKLISVSDYNVIKVISLYAAAAISDFFDGYVARKTESDESKVGKMYDNLADKLLNDSLLYLVGWDMGGVYGILARIAVIEDALLIIVRFKFTLNTNWFGKSKMALQSLAVGFLLISPLNPALFKVSYWFLWLALAAAAGSLWGHISGKSLIKKGGVLKGLFKDLLIALIIILLITFCLTLTILGYKHFEWEL